MILQIVLQKSAAVFLHGNNMVVIIWYVNKLTNNNLLFNDISVVDRAG